jgi:hypothetical protein
MTDSTPGNSSEPTTPTNPAVERCCEARKLTYQAEKAKHTTDYDAAKEASRAYRNAMPPLSGYENTCNFIACVAHGILTGSIDGKTGTKLLYAAQVALSTVRLRPKPKVPGEAKK